MHWNTCGCGLKVITKSQFSQVPILKFFDRTGGLEVILVDQIANTKYFSQVDLSVNNPTSIRNTHLLFCYSQVGQRFADYWLLVWHGDLLV